MRGDEYNSTDTDTTWGLCADHSISVCGVASLLWPQCPHVSGHIPKMHGEILISTHL